MLPNTVLAILLNIRNGLHFRNVIKTKIAGAIEPSICVCTFSINTAMPSFRLALVCV